jgi:hypothetical protein
MLDKAPDENILALADVGSHAHREICISPQKAFVGHRRDCRLLVVALLQSTVERDETFERRRDRMEGLVGELRERTAQIAKGGGDRLRSVIGPGESCRHASASTASSTRAQPSSS